jgi:hypothetical protein
MIAISLAEIPGVDERYRAVNRVNVQNTPHWQRLSPELREAIEVVSLCPSGPTDT